MRSEIIINTDFTDLPHLFTDLHLFFIKFFSRVFTKLRKMRDKLENDAEKSPSSP